MGEFGIIGTYFLDFVGIKLLIFPQCSDDSFPYQLNKEKVGDFHSINIITVTKFFGFMK